MGTLIKWVLEERQYGARLLGRPRIYWNDQVKNDLRMMGMYLEIAEDGGTWKCLVGNGFQWPKKWWSDSIATNKQFYFVHLFIKKRYLFILWPLAAFCSLQNVFLGNILYYARLISFINFIDISVLSAIIFSYFLKASSSCTLLMRIFQVTDSCHIPW